MNNLIDNINLNNMNSCSNFKIIFMIITLLSLFFSIIGLVLIYKHKKKNKVKIKESWRLSLSFRSNIMSLILVLLNLVYFENKILSVLT